jgi:hypothetical protein
MTAIEMDDFGKMAFDRYVQDVEQYNAAVAKGEAVESREKFEETFLDTAPELAEFNAQIQQLIEKANDLKSERNIQAQPLITPAYEKALNEVGVDPEAIKELKKKVAAGVRYLTTMYGEEVLVDAPKAKAMRAGGTGGTTGTRRIHGFDVYVDGKLSGTKNKEGVLQSNFASGARDLGIETIELQRMFFDKAGREDYKAEDFPASVEFNIGDKKVLVAKVGESEDEAE